MMITPEQRQALDVARGLVRSGVPVFLAWPDDTRPEGYALPKAWQQSTPDPQIVDAWRPGLALCAVTGQGLDLVDVDPRSGGTTDGVPMPEVYLAAETPSGGAHYFVRSLGVPSLDGVFPGVDLKSGTPDGSGRGFAFIAPTVRRSKVDGVERPYRWVGSVPTVAANTRPDDHSGDALRERVAELRGSRGEARTPRRVPRSVAAREYDSVRNRLVADLRRWAATGWGGEAHSGLLTASTALARLSPEHAEHAFREAFRAAGLEPDLADLAKLESALQRAVPDIVVPDEDMSPSERFLAGGDSPLGVAASTGSSAPAPVVDADGEELPYAVALELQRLRDRARAREIFEAERAGSAPGQLEALSFAELQLMSPPTPLIAGLLDRGTYAVMPGQFGSFKTFTALSWAFALALGKPWGEHEVPAALPVLYVATEGAANVMRRLNALAEHHGVAVPPTLRVVPRVADLGSDAVVDRLGELAAGMGAALLITDTLHQCTPGLDENSNTDMGAVLGRMRRRIIEPTGITWLAPHHTGHDALRSRGASCIEDDADTVLLATVKGGNEAARSLSTPRYLEVRKSKDGESGKKITLVPHLIADSVVVEPQGSGRSAAGFFGIGDDREVKARALVERLERYRAAGGDFRLSVRSIKNTVKVEMGERIDDRVIEHAARLMKAAVGMPVNLDITDAEVS